MRFFRKTILRVPAILPAMAAVVLFPLLAAAAQKNVLILHSYHQSSQWTDSIMAGMMEVLGDTALDLNIHVEYMDAERHPSESSAEDLEDFLRSKYEGMAFSVILLSDDNALDFILPRRHTLFPGVPVVFCGINDFQKERLRGETGITGINQDVGIRETIDFALQLKPDIQKFLVINDRTVTGIANRARYERDMAGFSNGAIDFELMEDFTLAQLQTRLETLPPNAAVLILSFHQTGDARQLSPEDYSKFLTDRCSAPVFTLWRADVDDGALGGVVVSEKAQGTLAAGYALRILQGEPASSIPVEMKSPKEAMVDYRKLKRFGIPVRSIPKGTRILHEPESAVFKYRHILLQIAFTGVTLIAIIVILSANIAVRRKTEKALKESQEKLFAALEMARLGHWEFDTESGLFVFNDQFYAIFHTTAADAGGYSMTPDEYAHRFVHPDDKHLIEEALKNASLTPDPRYKRRIEYRIRYSDGASGYMAVKFFIEKDDHGHTKKICGVAQDITELRQAEDNIIKSEERWRLILQTAMDGFSLVDRGGRFIEVNDAFCRMLGYSREELLTMHVADISPERDMAQAEIQIQRIISLGADRFETVHRRKDGKLIDTEICIQYRPMDSGLLAAFLRDVTERKRVETRLHQGQKMEAVGTLAGGIAHDFNNILQPMLGFCELLKSDLPPDAPEQGFVDGILDAALRAKDLVNQILSFSRQVDEEARPTRLQPVIKEALKLLRASIPTTIDIRQNIDPDCGIVMADPTQIYQIVMNLCTNAYHAMENGGGTLKLALEQIHLERHNPVFPEISPGVYALLKVSDTGVGIPRTLLNKVFDPYFTTKEKDKGTGLGLSIVQGIVKRYGGDIRIYSETGRGTEIHVYLPVMEKEEGSPGARTDVPIQGGSERILLVDDEKTVAEMIHRMLERLGYRVTTRIGSPDALEAFRAGPDNFDLVITDLTMPRMTGIQLVGEIKKIRGDIPVILCTGFSEQIPGDKLKAAGIQAKLAKPVITRTLAETVRNVLAAGKGGDES